MTDFYSRRDMFKTLGGAAVAAFVALKADNGDTVHAVVDAKHLPEVDFPSGQTVDDIVIGVVGTPLDVSYVINFYKKSTPDVVQLSVPLNARSTFRWCAAPGREIRLVRGDRLLWKVAKSELWPKEGLDVVVHTLGECGATRRTVLNQCQIG